MNEFEDTLKNLLLGGGMAALCGLAHYLQRVSAGRTFKILEFLLYGLTSALCGIIVGTFMLDAGASWLQCMAFCGVAGWMGNSLLDAFEYRITNGIKRTRKSPKKGKKNEETSD